jgi:hypothetical protein
LKDELFNVLPVNAHDRIKLNHFKNESHMSSWIGGNILLQMSSFESSFVTRDEYDEHGTNIILSKCSNTSVSTHLRELYLDILHDDQIHSYEKYKSETLIQDNPSSDSSILNNPLINASILQSKVLNQNKNIDDENINE